MIEIYTIILSTLDISRIILAAFWVSSTLAEPAVKLGLGISVNSMGTEEGVTLVGLLHSEDRGSKERKGDENGSSKLHWMR